jgi:hypothetical protein
MSEQVGDSQMTSKPTTSDIEARYAQQPRAQKHLTPGEPLELRYARQTRNATVFIACVVAIGVAFAVIAGLVIGTRGANAVNNPGIVGGGGSSCLSQGGYDPSC